MQAPAALLPLCPPQKAERAAAQGNGDGNGEWRIAKSAGGKLKLHTKRETKGESPPANLGIICYPRDKGVQKTDNSSNSSSDSSTTGNNHIDNNCDKKKHERTCRPIVNSRHCRCFSIFVGSGSDAI